MATEIPHSDWQGCPNHQRVKSLERWQEAQNGSLGRMADDLGHLRLDMHDSLADIGEAKRAAVAAAASAQDAVARVDASMDKLFWTIVGLAVLAVGSVASGVVALVFKVY